MSSLRQTPLTCSGHTRPVVFLAFSEVNNDGIYFSISACKDGNRIFIYILAKYHLGIFPLKDLYYFDVSVQFKSESLQNVIFRQAYAKTRRHWGLDWNL